MTSNINIIQEVLANITESYNLTDTHEKKRKLLLGVKANQKCLLIEKCSQESCLESKKNFSLLLRKKEF